MRRTSRPSNGAASRRLLSLAGNPPTIKRAVCIVVERLLEGISCPPTDLDAVLAKLNIELGEPEPLPIAGQLRRDGKALRIVYSKYLRPARRRFTIAHELGHAILESTGRNCPRKGDDVEALCDAIAVELLMPRTIFADHVKGNVSLANLLEIRDIFQTSLYATAKRCTDFSSTCTFQVEGQNIAWTTHARVGTGFIRNIDDDLQKVILAAKDTSFGDDQICFENDPVGWWRVEWLRLRNQEGYLFHLLPLIHEKPFTSAAFENLRTVKATLKRAS